MPLNSAQLAELVNRAKLKTPPVVSPPPPAQHPVRPRQATPAPQVPSPTAAREKVEPPDAPAAAVSAVPASASQSEQVDHFPIGWMLSKESWHFHRRFHRIFRRPMRQGEYSQLLGQIRRRTGEHLWEDCWRVTLPGSSRALPVRATHWRLITILPKNWQPPAGAV
jgi:hypothetical protein